MIRPFGVVFAGREAFPCSLFEYETHERHWQFYYCLIASHRCVLTGTGRHFLDRRIDSSGAGLEESLWQKKKKKKKRKDLLPLLLLIFSPFVFFLFQAFNSYPAWKNLPDSTAKRYLRATVRKNRPKP